MKSYMNILTLVLLITSYTSNGQFYFSTVDSLYSSNVMSARLAAQQLSLASKPYFKIMNQFSEVIPNLTPKEHWEKYVNGFAQSETDSITFFNWDNVEYYSRKPIEIRVILFWKNRVKIRYVSYCFTEGQLSQISDSYLGTYFEGQEIGEYFRKNYRGGF